MIAVDFSAAKPGCSGKAGFVGKAAALATIKCRMDRHRRLSNGAKRLEAYRCRECGQWHIAGKRA